MDIMLQRIICELKRQGKKQYELTDFLGLNHNSFGNWKSGLNTSYKKYIHAIATYLNVSVEYLRGETDEPTNKFPSPIITDRVATFPAIGEVAAGYNHIAIEDWTGDTVEIPESYLRGRPVSDYFVLTVSGDSMYPVYMDGDKVLILRQSSIDYSGQIGVIRYDGDKASLKKIEYDNSGSTLRMVPVNPMYKPVEISGIELEQCSIIGIPKLLIRNI